MPRDHRKIIDGEISHRKAAVCDILGRRMWGSIKENIELMQKYCSEIGSLALTMDIPGFNHIDIVTH